jgi:hypothetical protein
MPCPNPTDREDRDPSTLTADDRQVQRAVLALLLDRHPIRLTFVELGEE